MSGIKTTQIALGEHKELKNAVSIWLTAFINGVPERIRTSDTRFRRAVLCPLSYRDIKTSTVIIAYSHLFFKTSRIASIGL